jgi:HJR/Mrr/RecB family endonuclease
MPDSLRPPTRLVWQGEKGVFLTDRQEKVTLEKLQWKEQYKNDAVTMYFVALALQDRVKDLETQNTECRAALRKTEDESLANNTKLAESNLRLKDEQAANAILRDEKKALEVKLFKTRVVTVSLGLGLGLAGYYIITH